MRSLISMLFVLSLIAISGCSPAPQNTSSLTSTAGVAAIQSSRQDTDYLPSIDGSNAQAAATTLDKQEWLQYNHDYWGITFDYPADWRVDMPDLKARVEAPEGEPDYACLPADIETTDCTYTTGVTNTIDMQMATTYGYQVTLKPAEHSVGASGISISLETMTLAPGMTLKEWIKISNQYGLKNYGYDWENYEPTLIPFPHEDRPNVDEIWIDLAEDSQQANATIYMSIGKLVYAVRFRPGDPALRESAEKFVSSLEFDLAKQQELAALPFYSADITVLQPFLDEPTPAPTDEQPSGTPDSPNVSLTPTAVQ